MDIYNAKNLTTTVFGLSIYVVILRAFCGFANDINKMVL